MPAKNWDIYFNELFRDYLRTSASQAAGVPTTSVMPIRTSQDKEAVTRPRAVISHERRPETLRHIYDALFTVTGHFLDDPAQGITSSSAELYMQDIRQRLADTDALQAYIATLSSETQQGWQPVVHHLMHLPFKRDLDEETGHLELSFDFTFTVVTTLA